MNVIAWYDGRILGPGEPVVGALAHGFTVGDGAFETIAIRRRQPFALRRHLARLETSLARIGLVDLDPARVVTGIRAVVERGEGRLTRLRVTVAAGSGPLGVERVPGKPIIVVAGSDAAPRAACDAVRAPWRRNEYSPLVGMKTTSWGEQVMYRSYARSKNADETLLANTQGHLCEGASTNVWIERQGEIVTPPIASGCVPGISRGLALEWGRAAGLPVREGEVGELEYAVLDEVLEGGASASVSAVTRGVQPVSTLDGAPCRPGPLLARLREVYETNADGDLDPAPAGG